MGAYQNWSNEQDEVILEMIRKAKEGNRSKAAAFLACTEHELFQHLTVKSVSSRFYALNRRGLVPAELLDNRPVERQEESDSGEIDVIGMIGEIKKVIRERDDYKFRYEAALEYKNKYDEVKKKLARIEREFAAFNDLLKGRG